MRNLSFERINATAAVEKLIAEIQEALVGVRPMPEDRFEHRIALLGNEIEALGVESLVADLVREPSHPDVSSGFLDLTLDEEGREASLRAWEDLARERLASLWTWMTRLDRSSDRPWWSDDTPFPLSEDTTARLRAPVPAVEPIGSIVERWAAGASVTTPRRQHVWRWLALGHNTGVTMPPLPLLIERLVRRLRSFDLLPLAHQVQVMRLPRRSSMVVPVRVPGRSILTLPTASPTPLTLEYVIHELGHLAENALRPPRASLRDRWSFDPVRSEGIAMLFELALRSSPEWLEDLGFSITAADRIRAFLEEEERFTANLIVATVTLGDRIASFRTIDDALESALAIAETLDIEWSPELMLFRLPRLAYWRAIVAGNAWSRSAASVLSDRFGPGWANEPRAWAAVRRAMGTIGSAGDTLAILEEAP